MCAFTIVHAFLCLRLCTQALEEAAANMDALSAHRTETAAANKWLEYQDSLAARERMRRAAE